MKAVKNYRLSFEFQTLGLRRGGILVTLEEAWKIIDACKGWNASQKSPSLAFGGVRTPEDDIYDARRSALAAAWRVVSRETA